MDIFKLDDGELVRRVLAGDKDFFAALIERYADALTWLALVNVRNAQDAQDIVQEAFFAAFCNLRRLAEPERFGAWIKGTVLNMARKTVDRRARTERFLSRLPHPPLAPTPADEFANKETLRHVVAALDALDEPHREVVVLHYLHGMKLKHIAEMVSRPLGTVKRMIFEARGSMKEELISMAREQFSEYSLSEEHRKRLAMIPKFPQREPKISVTPVAEEATEIQAVASYGNFPPLSPGAEACYADYDYPDRELTTVSHVFVEGPLEVQGEQAVRFNSVSFTGEGKPEWTWRPYYRIRENEVLYCAKEYGSPDSGTSLLTPDHPDWNEPQPRPENLRIVPGSRTEPSGDWGGFVVDADLWQVQIDDQTFACVRRLGGGALWDVDWSEAPVTFCATEQYFLEDGRMLLWRRYNGLRWSEQNPGRAKDAPSTYERLAEAGVPSIEVFGETYYLYYDQIPDYAL